MYAFQERPENFSGRVASQSGSAAAQRNAAGRVLKAHASEKWYRSNSQRIGAWARDETDEISRLKPSRFVTLLHGRGLQCETISKSARIPDENAGAEPGVRSQGRLFPVPAIVTGKHSPAAKLFCYPHRLLAVMTN